jgi:hypothetical protein
MRVVAVAAFGVVMSVAASVPGLVLRWQTPAVKFDVPVAAGLAISPVYEGWYQHNGATYALFGYVNRNLEEIVDLPVGPNNKVEPGPIDQGQPTRFFPGQHYGVFAVAVPKDRPKTEVTWTLQAHGQTLAIPGVLDQLYFISPQKNAGGTFPGKTPPVIKFDPSGPSAQGPLGITVSRTAAVSRPLELDVWVTDDGVPRVQAGEDASFPSVASGRPPQELAVSWSVYRAPDSGTVRFGDPKPKLQQGKARTTVTFSQAGEYVLHFVAVDTRSSTKCCWTNGYVKVVVAAGDTGR